MLVLVLVLVEEAEPVIVEMGIFCVAVGADVGAEVGPGVIVGVTLVEVEYGVAHIGTK